MFLLINISVTSATKIKTDYENKPSLPISDIIVDAGSIVVDLRQSIYTTECIYKDNFNLNVGPQGANIIVKVDYIIKCPGSADEGYIEISFEDGSDTDFFTYGGDYTTGELTISKFMNEGEIFSVELFAKLTDWWGFTLISKSNAVSFISDGPTVNDDYDSLVAGTVYIDSNMETTIQEYNSDPNNPLNIDCIVGGGRGPIRLDYNVECLDQNRFPMTLTMRYEGFPETEQSLIVEGPTRGSFRVEKFLNPGELSGIKFTVHYFDFDVGYVDFVGKSYFKTRDHTPPTSEMEYSGGWPHKKVEFTIDVTDHEDDALYYKLDYGDGNIIDWTYQTHPYPATIYKTHTYKRMGTYIATLYTKDEYGLETIPPTTLEVKVGFLRTRSISTIYNGHLITLLQKLLDQI